MTTKDEALNAIETARKMLDSPEPMTGLRLNLLRSTLEFAASSVEKLQEVKRKRTNPTSKGATNA
ncbi:MAG: hypothetical protein PHS14_16940 [Elusimicrobia bacterium]|nr:hypothetical protein [Elusimicrobiota bacterium]